MPFNLELRDENGQVVASTVGVDFASSLPPLADHRSPILRFIDPYGDTVLNRAQCQALLEELRATVSTSWSHALRELAERCAEEVHTYLWIIGD